MDYSSETPVLLAKAGKHIPGNPHASTPIRWALHGVRGGHKLESFLCGGRRFTTVESIGRFLARLNGTEAAPSPKQQADRERRVAKARAELRARGV